MRKNLDLSQYKSIVGYGIGQYYDYIKERIPPNIHINYLCDTRYEQIGNRYNGIEVISPSQLRALDDVFVIVFSGNHRNYQSISSMLEQMALPYLHANQIIDEIEKNVKPNLPFDHALADVYQKMILKFGKAVPIEKNGKGLRVIFFAGPTGVGKTTTIAKIASSFRLEQKQKVALFTADTYRIAAAEQLRTYANILEIPFRVVYSVEDLQAGVSDFRNYDFILVDMAGHSPNNPTLRESMNAFIHGLEEGIEKEVHLVLSATTKYADMVNIVDSYSDLDNYKIIFTKLDETKYFGPLINIPVKKKLPLLLVTTGQNVPDDIEYFNPQSTVKQLLGGRR